MTRQLLADKREGIDTRITRLFEGNAFNVSWLSPEGSNVADNAIFGIVLLTGPVETLLNYDIIAAGGTEAYLYETPTIGTTGTAMTIYNANRSTSGRGSQFLAWHSPANVTGTIIAEHIEGVSNSILPLERDWILRTGTFYAIVGVNRSGGAELASVTARWYETDTES